MSFDLKEIYGPIEEELDKVEERLKAQFSDNGRFLSYVNSYMLNIPGKRLRPALVLLCTQMVNEKIDDEILDFALAVELIHSATLVHDDIMDNSILRRGQKSVNEKWGNHIAVLVGDSFYAKSFSILAKWANGKIFGMLSKTVEEMCEGEVEQTRNKLNVNMKEETYLKIIGRKTAQFLSICCKGGAFLAGADTKTINSLEEYGFNLGMAYQIIDDCLDIEKDVQNGEITLPVTHLLEIASPDDREAVVRMITGSNGRIYPADFIIDALDRYSVINYVLDKAAEYIMKAKERLEKANSPLSASGNSLFSFADYIYKIGQTKVLVKQSV